jgi:hypothetical protein
MRIAFTLTLAAISLSISTRDVAAQNVLVSRNSNGDQPNDPIYELAMNDDGTKFTLGSPADNLGESPDDNGLNDVFLRDLTTGRTIRISQKPLGGDANASSGNAVISGDGLFVAFTTIASNLFLNDQNSAQDVVVYDVAAAKIRNVSIDSNGAQANADSSGAGISRDGGVVVFTSNATNLVANDTNGVSDVFLRDRNAGTTVRVSVAADGTQANSDSNGATVSADGRYVAFSSRASNLGAGRGSGYFDVFLKDMATGAVEMMNIAADGSYPQGGDSGQARVSADGSVVTFVSEAYLVSGDLPHTREVYVHDRVTNQTELASISLTGGFPDQECSNPWLSSDGRFVTYVSNASNLVAGTNGTWQIFVRDRLLGVTMLAVYDRDQQVEVDGFVTHCASPDGSLLAFISPANDLTFDDTLPYSVDAFVRTQPVTPAAWSNYGDGWPGSNGTPSFVASAAPAFGQTITLTAGSSLAHWSVGILLAGAQPAELPTGWGGKVELLPTFVVAAAIPPEGVSFDVTCPADERLTGVSWYAQFLEQDAGASDGVSFTPGLQLALGF